MDYTLTGGVEDMNSIDDSTDTPQHNKPTGPSEIEMFSSVTVTLSRPFIRGFHFATKAAAESLFTEVAGAASVVFNSAPGTNPDDPVFSLKGSHQNILRSETLLRAKFQEVPGNTNTPIKTGPSSGDCATAVKQTQFMEPSHPLATLGQTTSEITADEMKIISDFLEKKHMLAVLRRGHLSFTFLKQAAPVSEGLQVPSSQYISVSQGFHTNSGQTSKSRSLQSNTFSEPMKVPRMKGGRCAKVYLSAVKHGILPVQLPSAELSCQHGDMSDGDADSELDHVDTEDTGLTNDRVLSINNVKSNRSAQSNIIQPSNSVQSNNNAQSIHSVLSNKQFLLFNNSLQSNNCAESKHSAQYSAQSNKTAQSNNSAQSNISVQSINSAQSDNSAQSINSAQSSNSAQSNSSAQSNKTPQSNNSAQSNMSVQCINSAQSDNSAQSINSAQSNKTAQSINSSHSNICAQSSNSAQSNSSAQSNMSVLSSISSPVSRHTPWLKSQGTTSVNESSTNEMLTEISHRVIVNELEQHSLTMQDIIGMEREAFAEGNRTKCPICNQEFSKIGALSLHVYRDHQKFECPYCKTFYTKKDLLLLHIKHKHASLSQPLHQNCALKSTKHVRCGDCRQVFPNRRDLDGHQTLRHSHQGRETVCFICGEEIIGRMCNLMKHIKNLHIHCRIEQGQSSICDICGKSYVDLQGHRKRHFMEKKHPCEICGKLFKDKQTVKIHQQIHQPQEQRSFPFMCSFCGRRFCNKGGLNKHLTTHTGERPFSCDQCGKRFRVKSTLKNHKWHKHSDERPFQCTLCSKAFKANYVLESHMVTHTGVSDHVCPHCKHPFGTKVHLKSHLPKCKKRDRSPSEANLDVVKKPRKQRGLRKVKKPKITESEELDDLGFTWTGLETEKVESSEIDDQHVYMCSSCGSTYPDIGQAEKHISMCLFIPPSF